MSRYIRASVDSLCCVGYRIILLRQNIETKNGPKDMSLFIWLNFGQLENAESGNNGNGKRERKGEKICTCSVVSPLVIYVSLPHGRVIVGEGYLNISG